MHIFEFKLLNTHSWSSWLPYWSFSYNTTVHTETLYSPFELVFVYPARLPSNSVKQIEPLYTFDNYPLELIYRLQQACTDARNNLLESKHRRKDMYDRKCNVIDYKLGDKVLLRNLAGKKSEALYEGPYTIVELESPNVSIRVKGKLVTVHKNRIRPYFE